MAEGVANNEVPTSDGTISPNDDPDGGPHGLRGNAGTATPIEARIARAPGRRAGHVRSTAGQLAAADDPLPFAAVDDTSRRDGQQSAVHPAHE
jgi:hypothetical protein